MVTMDLPPGVTLSKATPFFLTLWFWIAILLLIILICVSAYSFFRISLRNRTIVIIHLPNKDREIHNFKNFVGDIFKIATHEKTKDNLTKYHEYFFRPDALETGYFGKYIEYDYKISEPRKPNPNNESIKLDFDFISAVLNTDLAVDLLLSKDFKNFVKMMLIVILIISILIFIIGLFLLYFQLGTTPTCSLAPTNETLTTIKLAMNMK
jgi:hypothetical protein